MISPFPDPQFWSLVYNESFEPGVKTLVIDELLTADFLAIYCEANQNVARIGRFNHEEQFPGFGWNTIARYPLSQGVQLLTIEPRFFAQYRLSFQQDLRYPSPLLVSLKIWSPIMPLSRSGGSSSGVSAPTPATQAIPTSVNASTSSVTLLAANAARKGATIWNSSTATLYVDLDTSSGATASATDYTVTLGPGDYYEVPYDYTGIILGIWDVATGKALIRELL